MAFSFTPGQEQTTAQPVQQMKNGIPALVVPIPNIAVGEGVVVVEKISPFAFKNRSKSKFGIYFQSVVFLVFGIVVLTIIGLFAYISVLKKEIASKSEALTATQASFPVLPLEDMKKFSDRLQLINKVIKEHASVRVAFRLLEDSVENPVIYTKFDLSKNQTKKGYTLSFNAETDSYHVAYQQTEILKSKTYSNYLTPLEISGLSLDKKGTVNFKINTTIFLEGILPDSITFDDSGLSTSTVSGTNQASSTPDQGNTP